MSVIKKTEQFQYSQIYTSRHTHKILKVLILRPKDHNYTIFLHALRSKSLFSNLHGVMQTTSDVKILATTSGLAVINLFSCSTEHEISTAHKD